jgi:hypothetical protein
MFTETTADAAYVPGSLRRGDTVHERLRSILAIAEPILGVDRAAGERGWVRVIKSTDARRPDPWLFVTRDPNDTLLFPVAAPPHLAQKPRYDWVEGPSGIRLGYLKSEARALDAGPSLPPGIQ